MVFTKIKDGAMQSKTVDTQKKVFVPYELVPFLAKPMPTRDTFLIAHDWATNGGSVDCCINLLNLLQVGMTLSGLANILAVVQGQIGDPVMPSAYLVLMMKTKVLEACLPGLAPKPAVVAGASNLAMENLLTKIGEVQINNMKKEEIWRAEKEAPKPLTAQYLNNGQYNTLCTLTGSDLDASDTVPKLYHKLANLTKRLGNTQIIQYNVNGLAR